MSKLLILVTNYPDNKGGVALMYVHVRNVAYAKEGIKLSVLSFAAKDNYFIDGIQVITYKYYLTLPSNEFKMLILHAANIRQHMLFLKKFGQRFDHFIFFFHGHEVLRINKVYPEPYNYLNKTIAKKIFQELYDTFKLQRWRLFFKKQYQKTDFVFVSKWMLDEFLRWTKVPQKLLIKRSHIIYNGINLVFEENKWDRQMHHDYDFITIRGNWDGSKYCVDIVNELAKNNPKLKFLLIGKGQFFNHYEKASNLILLKQHLQPKQMLEYLNDSRCALMPTRTDAQGLMMCEIASYGMPLITSDIPVSHEVFEEFDNVYFIKNNDTNLDLNNILLDMEETYINKENKKFYEENTLDKEIDLVKKLL